MFPSIHGFCWKPIHDLLSMWLVLSVKSCGGSLKFKLGFVHPNILSIFHYPVLVNVQRHLPNHLVCGAHMNTSKPKHQLQSLGFCKLSSWRIYLWNLHDPKTNKRQWSMCKMFARIIFSNFLWLFYQNLQNNRCSQLCIRIMSWSMRPEIFTLTTNWVKVALVLSTR